MAWEQVSHNDAALTDVGQLFISLPNSAPSGHRQTQAQLTEPAAGLLDTAKDEIQA